MQGTTLATQGLPIALGLIMLGLGLSLTVDDFRRIARYPKPVVVGLLCQVLLLPAAAFLLCVGFGLSPELSVGMMILAASPGGITANVFSHLARGDVALNLTLTALNSVLAAVTLPLVVGFALTYFLASSTGIGPQLGKMVEVFAMVLVPVGIGMLVKRRWPIFAERADRPMRLFSLFVLVVIIIAAIAKEKDNIASYAMELGGVVLTFNLLSLGVGYVLPSFIKLPQRQSIAIAMEVGIHNSTLAIYIALSVLQNYAYAMPAAVYSIVMFFTAGVFAVLVNQRKSAGSAAPA